MKIIPLVTHSIVIFSECCQGSKQIHRVVCDSVLRDHASPVAYVGIVSKCENSRIRDLIRQKFLGPWGGGILGFPRLFTIASEAMDEDNAKLKVRKFPGVLGSLDE
jgi:hypothetical protein